MSFKLAKVKETLEDPSYIKDKHIDEWTNDFAMCDITIKWYDCMMEGFQTHDCTEETHKWRWRTMNTLNLGKCLFFA